MSKHSLSKAVTSDMQGILKSPGDKISAEVTPSGLGVVKIDTSEIKSSSTIYPTTGTIVETKTYRNDG